MGPGLTNPNVNIKNVVNKQLQRRFGKVLHFLFCLHQSLALKGVNPRMVQLCLDHKEVEQTVDHSPERKMRELNTVIKL